MWERTTRKPARFNAIWMGKVAASPNPNPGTTNTWRSILVEGPPVECGSAFSKSSTSPANLLSDAARATHPGSDLSLPDNPRGAQWRSGR